MSTFALFLDLTIETVRDLRRRERPAGSGEDPRYLETGLRDCKTASRCLRTTGNKRVSRTTENGPAFHN